MLTTNVLINNLQMAAIPQGFTNGDATRVSRNWCDPNHDDDINKLKECNAWLGSIAGDFWCDKEYGDHKAKATQFTKNVEEDIKLIRSRIDYLAVLKQSICLVSRNFPEAMPLAKHKALMTKCTNALNIINKDIAIIESLFKAMKKNMKKEEELTAKCDTMDYQPFELQIKLFKVRARIVFLYMHAMRPHNTTATFGTAKPSDVEGSESSDSEPEQSKRKDPPTDGDASPKRARKTTDHYKPVE